MGLITLSGWKGVVAVAGALAMVTGNAPMVDASSFDYVTTTSPIPALTAYYSAVGSHTGNEIRSCQIPTFAAAIYLTTTGGIQIRRVDGNCPLANTGHVAEGSTRANCANKTTAAKYAACTRFYI